MVEWGAFNLGEPSLHSIMIHKTITSAAILGFAFAAISCQPIKKDPYDTGGLYGYPDAGYENNPDGSLYDVPADFEDAAPTPDPEPSSTTYTVARGDTLSKISKMHNVSMKSIISANNISNPNMLRVGQTLTIPAN